MPEQLNFGSMVWDDSLDYNEWSAGFQEVGDDYIVIECPVCYNFVLCTECGQDPNECTCVDEPDTFFCTNCNEFFSLGGDNSVFESAKQAVSLVKSAPSAPVAKHDHIQQPIVFPSGRKVTATAGKFMNDSVQPADFGLYADPMWVKASNTRNEIINWPDFGIPKYHDLAIDQIDDAYDAAATEHVDVGCIGAHGRTGTILAIMAVIDGAGKVTASEAVKWVRSTYCHEAVETLQQEWFVAYAAHRLYGHELPEKTAIKKEFKNALFEPHGISGSTACSITEHLAMFDKGYKTCAFDAACKWFQKDLSEMNENGTIAKTPVEKLRLQEVYLFNFNKLKLPEETNE